MVKFVSSKKYWRDTMYYEKNFKDTLDDYLADCSRSRLFLGV